MLILTRKKDESIIIDNNIEIVIVGIEDGKVKLGIKAPKHVSIHRKEVYIEIERENKEASNINVNMTELKKMVKK